MAAPASVPAEALPQAVRTVTQDQRGATFQVTPGAARFDSVRVDGADYARVSLPGAVVVEAPGRPALPSLTLHVAIPDGMSPRLRVTAEEWADRPGLPPLPVTHERFLADDPKTGPISEYRTVPEPAIYRGTALYPPEAALVGAGALVGEWWIAPIHVRPVRWDPRAKAYRVLRSMTLRVDFVPATDRELSARPASRPGAQARVWDRLQRGLVKNYESARSFPARPRAGTLAPSGGALERARLATNPEWKISVTQTGWVSVSYATLASSGFPSGINIANVRVEERGYDDIADTATVTPIPVVARDNNTNGLFDAGDAVTFYARSIRDRYGAGHIELRYSDVNVYWLTWGSTPAPVPGTISGAPGGGATVPVSFRDVIRLEQDQFVLTAPNPNFTFPPEAVEYLFWTNGMDPDQFDTPIPFVDPNPAQPFRIRARYQGQAGSVHRLDIFFQSSTGVVDTLTLDNEFEGQDVFLLDTGFTIPGSHIGAGTNSFRHFGEHRSTFFGPLLPGSYSFLDVVEATYDRFYIARGNLLRFTSGGSGSVFEPHVGGFTSNNIRVYDVTDPVASLEVTGVLVTPVTGGTYEASFQTDATAGERRFIAFVPGVETSLTAPAVVADLASNLRTPSPFATSSVARTIFVAPPGFLTEANRLADYRRSQGYVVEVADVQDVYDEFNGGLKSAHAIRRLFRHAYLAWTPRLTYGVLLGDASLDYRHHLSSSGADWVPTYLRFETIAGPQGRELVAHDSYYSLNLSHIEPLDNDFVPSIMVSRIPASDPGALGQFVDKVVRYESFQASDSWRGRQLLFSDDLYSLGIVGNEAYCLHTDEADFYQASLDMAAMAANGPGSVDIRSDFFNLEDYTDAVPPSGNCKNLGFVKSALVGAGHGYDVLATEIAKGGLIFNLESHANRYWLAHEVVLCSGNVQFCDINGPDKIQNVERPFYLMVWGCHTNQFPDGPLFASATLDSSDAFGEVWLNLPDRGSIGSFGSSGYEYLSTNRTYNHFAAESFYSAPPSPGDPPQARWVLGEVMLEAEVRNGLADAFFFQPLMNRTMHLLADPMLRMDALPPRVFEATIAGAPVSDSAPLTTDSPTDSLALVASLRDEVGIVRVELAERDVASGGITPVDSTLYTVAFSDSSRLATLTSNVRPRVGNYDLQVRATDINGRMSVFALQVRTPIRYLANGTEIVDNVFVQAGALLRAEVTAPIPLTADSLALLIDGLVVPSTKTQLDAAGRQWALEATLGDLFTGSHTIQVAIGGSTTGLDRRTFQMTSEFTLRGVAVVDPRMRGAGCGGSVFQYELSAAAQKVELLILTIAGRRLASYELPGQAGFNLYCWDGRDSQAHDAAQGVYLYRLRATDTSGRTVSKEGRMIRAR